MVEFRELIFRFLDKGDSNCREDMVTARFLSDLKETELEEIEGSADKVQKYMVIALVKVISLGSA